VIDGELDDDGREAVAEVAMRNGGPGATLSNPSSRTMIVSSGVMGSPFRMTVTSRDGSTRILVEDLRVTTRGLKGLMLGGVGALSSALVAIGAFGSEVGDLPRGLQLGAATLVVGVGTVLGVDKIDRSQRKKRVTKTFDELKAAVETHARKTGANDGGLEEARARQGVAAVASSALDSTRGEQAIAEVAADVVAVKR
jgi:hypothetical protein